MFGSALARCCSLLSLLLVRFLQCLSYCFIFGIFESHGFVWFFWYIFFSFHSLFSHIYIRSVNRTLTIWWWCVVIADPLLWRFFFRSLFFSSTQSLILSVIATYMVDMCGIYYSKSTCSHFHTDFWYSCSHIFYSSALNTISNLKRMLWYFTIHERVRFCSVQHIECAICMAKRWRERSQNKTRKVSVSGKRSEMKLGERERESVCARVSDGTIWKGEWGNRAKFEVIIDIIEINWWMKEKWRKTKRKHKQNRKNNNNNHNSSNQANMNLGSLRVN